MIPVVTRGATLATIIAIAGLAVALPGDTATAKPGAGCSQLRQHQVLRATVSWRYRIRVRWVTSSFSEVVQTLADETHRFGTILIAGATCKRPGGPWVVIDPIGVSYASAGLDPVGNIRGSDLMKGWGIGIRSGAGGSVPRISLQMMHCGRGNFFSTLKTIVGVPIPFLRYVVDVALWGVGHFLPADTVVCGDVGVKQLRVYADRSGAMRLADLGGLVVRAESKIDASNNAKDQRSVEHSYDVLPIAVAARG